MVENLDTGKRTRKTLQVTALLMAVSVLLLGARSRAGAPRPGEVAGASEAPMPAPAAFLGGPARNAPARNHGAGGAAAPEISERIAALSQVLTGGARSGRSDRSAGDPAARPAMPGGPAAAPSAAPVGEPPGRAEVVARLERGGAEYWLLSVQPEGRLVRAGVSPGAGKAGVAAPPAEPYLQRTDGRFELVTPGRRYRVVEPPWEGSHTAVVGESP